MSRAKHENTDHQRLRQAHAQIARLTLELEAARSESTEFEASLVQSDKMASLGVLTAGIAHEINNPIGYIVSNVATLGDYLPGIQGTIDELRALLEDLPADSPLAAKRDKLQAAFEAEDMQFVLEDTASLLEETREGAQRVLGIVRGLKDFARADEEKLELANLNDCLRATLNLVHNELKYSCEITTEFADLPSSYFNAGKLGQVFLNLLVNAGHAVGEQGQIQVRSDLVDGEFKIEIIDDGAGIPPHILNKIFEPFYTTKPKGKGTGLGLSISRGIVESHGGRIEVRSVERVGTTFVIWLPVVEDPDAIVPTVAQ